MPAFVDSPEGARNARARRRDAGWTGLRPAVRLRETHLRTLYEARA